jgi:ankyrin repeat protein
MKTLIKVAKEGRADVVASLLGTPGINMDAKDHKGQRAINYACGRGHMEVVKLLVAGGARLASKASDEVGALASAAKGGHLEVVKYLVQECGADASGADPEGKTPLMFAANQGHTEIFKYLLGRPGINVDAKTTTGRRHSTSPVVQAMWSWRSYWWRQGLGSNGRPAMRWGHSFQRRWGATCMWSSIWWRNVGLMSTSQDRME